MLKLTVAVLAVALAGTASAGGWRSLRIDASSEAGFAQSVEAFNDELPLARREVFVHALQDIWVQGVTAARADDREYTADEYFRQIHGLKYDEVVTLLDPTGETADARYREATRLIARGRMVANGPAPTQYWPNENQNWSAGWSYISPQALEHALAPAPGN
jgi:hypothetical protein